MSDKQKNSAILFGILVVIFLIIFTHPNDNKNFIESSASITKPFFPVQKQPQKEAMQALLTGELKLEGKCLKIAENLIVWPYGYSIDTKGDTIKVFNHQGKHIASIGDTIKLGGGQVKVSNTADSLSQFTNQNCDGPLWITAEVLDANK